MKQLIIFAGLLSLVLADYATVTPQPWQGPLADHILGIPPRDTPEVASAKAALNAAYSQVLAMLPVLPPEERYIPGPVHHQLPQWHPTVAPAVQVPIPAEQVHPAPLYHQLPQTQQYVKQAVLPQWQPAEQVLRSAFGEVPEVQAAREAHLKAYQEVAVKLPKLTETSTEHYHPSPALPGLFQNFQVVQDTPEVARAKAEHAAAVAAALG